MRPRVTAVTVCRDEALTVRESIASIVPFVDDVIVVDHGSVDETPDLLVGLRAEHGIRVIRREATTSYAECRNLTIAEAGTDWIIKWDADFIAYDGGGGCTTSIGALFDELMPAMPAATNMVLLHCPNCGPTLETTQRGNDVDGALGDVMVMRRDAARWVTGRYADTFEPRQPLHRVYLNRPESPAFLVQADKLKLPERLLLRDQMFKYDIARAAPDATPGDFADWLRRAGWNELDRLIEKLLVRMSETLADFDFARWGAHPAALRALADLVPYEIEAGAGGRRLRLSARYDPGNALRRAVEALVAGNAPGP